MVPTDESLDAVIDLCQMMAIDNPGPWSYTDGILKNGLGEPIVRGEQAVAVRRLLEYVSTIGPDIVMAIAAALKGSRQRMSVRESVLNKITWERQGLEALNDTLAGKLARIELLFESESRTDYWQSYDAETAERLRKWYGQRLNRLLGRIKNMP